MKRALKEFFGTQLRTFGLSGLIIAAACAPAIVVQNGRRISSAVRRIENESAVPDASGVLITIAICPPRIRSTT